MTKYRIISWPLGRLDISSDTLSIRSSPSWLMKPRTAPKADITAVRARQTYDGGIVLTVEDDAAVFLEIRLYAHLRGYYKLQADLEANGYNLIAAPMRRYLIPIRRSKPS
jgi:hypothetical protein